MDQTKSQKVGIPNTSEAPVVSGVKHEIVCIRRYGQSIRNTEGADFAAKVTYLAHTPGEVYDPRVGVKQEMLIPLLNNFC